MVTDQQHVQVCSREIARKVEPCDVIITTCHVIFAPCDIIVMMCDIIIEAVRAITDVVFELCDNNEQIKECSSANRASLGVCTQVSRSVFHWKTH